MSIAKMLTPPAELQIQLHQFINSQKAKVIRYPTDTGLHCISKSQTKAKLQDFNK